MQEYNHIKKSFINNKLMQLYRLKLLSCKQYTVNCIMLQVFNEIRRLKKRVLSNYDLEVPLFFYLYVCAINSLILDC